MNEDNRHSPHVAKMAAGLSAFCDALESGEPIEKRFTIRTVTLDLQVTRYGPEDVKRVRKMLSASQSLLAQFLGVSVSTIRSWEQGTRPVPPIACRYLDDIVAYPELWKSRVRYSSSKDAGKTRS
jgi:putative transcriptional regulator